MTDCVCRPSRTLTVWAYYAPEFSRLVSLTQLWHPWGFCRSDDEESCAPSSEETKGLAPIDMFIGRLLLTNARLPSHQDKRPPQVDRCRPPAFLPISQSCLVSESLWTEVHSELLRCSCFSCPGSYRSTGQLQLSCAARPQTFCVES